MDKQQLTTNPQQGQQLNANAVQSTATNTNNSGALLGGAGTNKATNANSKPASTEKNEAETQKFFNAAGELIRGKKMQIDNLLKKVEDKPNAIDDQTSGGKMLQYREKLVKALSDWQKQLTTAEATLATAKEKSKKQTNAQKLKDKANIKISECEAALKELTELEQSDVIYRIVEKTDMEGQAGGGVSFSSYDFEKNKEIIIVAIKSNSEAVNEWEGLAHELKHAYQYEKNLLSFFVDSTGEKVKVGVGESYDYQDEYEAYFRQLIFSDLSNKDRTIFDVFSPDKAKIDEVIRRTPQYEGIVKKYDAEDPDKRKENVSVDNSRFAQMGQGERDKNKKAAAYPNEDKNHARHIYKGFQNDNPKVKQELDEKTYNKKK